ncbi:ribose transport system ATP-binding protein [Nocardioides zeae]|uniref:Ribose transport system ATP-binding protein n=1 Tax=Nocardioides zeae TaxID=1457234 RepID=A0ACC6IF77_9ACTN|nr:sugar ABC transporter ATP-binding protein [Nocardioides zeae]MDR6174870.1 ribose transport system ATP-binding protein [Nocardioides zeae]MDR6209320.1 ribose transport system ATP-binding protein [Nocardioides zeae]
MSATHPAIAADAQPALQVEGLSKSYQGNPALSGFDLAVGRASIHALLGENGSGKSTLIKLLSGTTPADSGRIALADGWQSASKWNPRKARDAGIRVVHQDPGIFADMTVADNLAAGHRYPTGPGWSVKDRAWRAHTEKVLARFSVQATPEAIVGRLRPSTQTLVAIARALQDLESGTSGVLILDEPTASLPAGEVDVIFDSLLRLREQGQAVLFVSHRLGEVRALCDEVTVLRDGRHVQTCPTEGRSEVDLAEMMIGHPLATVVHAAPPSSSGTPLLEVSGLSSGPVNGLDLRVRESEIVGVAGLLASGRTSLLRTLFGDMQPSAGSIRLRGTELRLRHPSDAVAAKIAYVPEERRRDALFGDLTLASNMSAPMVRHYSRNGVLRTRAENVDARDLLSRFRVKAAGELVTPSTLSGGNAQKTVLARWLRSDPTLLLLDNPSQGVDIGAREDIHELIRAAVRTASAAAVVVSDDFEELAVLCDRVVVMHNGTITQEIDTSAMTTEGITRAVYGQRKATA